LTDPSPYLNQIVASNLGTSDCDSLSGSDASVCGYMKSRSNHDVFATYPSGFPYDAWLSERFILAQLFYSTSMATDYPGWLTTGDHCEWSGISCSSDKHITSVTLQNLNLTGPYPTNLNNLSAMTGLITDGNSLTGVISNDICGMTGIHIEGDASNCPNAVGTEGCCFTVVA